jgi:hypothetical protein
MKIYFLFLADLSVSIIDTETQKTTSHWQNAHTAPVNRLCEKENVLIR